MPSNLERLLEVNTGVGAPGYIPGPTTPAPTSTFPTSTPDVGSGSPLLDALLAQQGSGSGSGSGGIAKASRAIQRREIGFQKETGLRDIGQQREAGLKAAINNALQRGIFRSGIRKENVALVNREADEAESDLMSRIGFALERLDLSAKAGSGGGGGGSLDIPPALLEQLLIAEQEKQQQDARGFLPPPLPEGGGVG